MTNYHSVWLPTKKTHRIILRAICHSTKSKSFRLHRHLLKLKQLNNIDNSRMFMFLAEEILRL